MSGESIHIAWRWLQRNQAAALLLLVVSLLSAAASRLNHAPIGLMPGWLACGLTASPILRWRDSWNVAMTALAMIAGCTLGGTLEIGTAIGCLISAVQGAVVARALRRALPRLLADRRPLYRLRLAHLARFLFAITLPASVMAGALSAFVSAACGTPWPDAGRLGLLYAASSALSVAVLTPLSWTDQLRGISWPMAGAAAAAGLIVSLLVVLDPGLLWLASAVVMLSGYLGSTWTAVLTVACIAAGLATSTQFGHLDLFEGPDGYLVMLLVVWRLLTAGLLMSLWSERRARIFREHGAAKIHPTTAGGRTWWRSAAARDGRWSVVFLEHLVAGGAGQASPRMRPGSSLPARVELSLVAGRIRAGDAVIGLGARGAMLILRLRQDQEPPLSEIATRCRAATHEGIAIQRGGRFGTEVVSFLLDSATYLEEEPQDEPAPDETGAGALLAAGPGCGNA